MKILVIHATAGAGHRRAAEAIFVELKQQGSHDVRIVDALDHTRKGYKEFYSGSYTVMISHFPWIWKVVFELLDQKWFGPVVRFLRRMQNTVMGFGLHKFLIKEQFDQIYSAHFFPNEVASYLKRSGKIHSQVISVITDFDVHSIWVSKGIDFYAVACDRTKTKLQQLGVAADQIKVTGIPTDHHFAQPVDVPTLRRRLGLKPDTFTVLVATGSFGIGPIDDVIEALDGFQIIVICGHNKNLYQRLSRDKTELVKVHGLVDNMDELMKAADAMITKPGGLSISEGLVCGLPLIFFSAIPGQEQHNVQILKEYGVGLSDIPIDKMAEVLRRYQASQSELSAVKEKIAVLAKPHAARDIAAFVTSSS